MMNVYSADSSNTVKPLLGSVRLGRHWRGKVLLRFSDPAGLLPRAWSEVSIADWEKAVADPSELFSLSRGAQLLKDGPSSLVVRRQLELGQSQPEVFCKLSRRRNLLRKAIGLFRRTRPSRNWQVSWDLLARGIPTALPVAVLEKRVVGLCLAAIIITDSLLPGKTLERFVREDAPSLPVSLYRRLTTELAELIRRLHEHDFFHRDLKGVNIFVHFGPSSGPRFYLLDLDGCQPDGQGYLKKVKSLGRLARVSLDWPVVRRTDRLRFLKAYLQTPSKGHRAGPANSSPDWKTWWRDIDRQVRLKFPRGVLSDRNNRRTFPENSAY